MRLQKIDGDNYPEVCYLYCVSFCIQTMLIMGTGYYVFQYEYEVCPFVDTDSVPNVYHQCWSWIQAALEHCKDFSGSQNDLQNSCMQNLLFIYLFVFVCLGEVI